LKLGSFNFHHTVAPSPSFPSLQLGTVTLAGWRQSRVCPVVRVSVRPAYARLSMPSCKLGSARRRPWICALSFIQKFWRVPPERGRQARVGWRKQAIFWLYASISRKRYEIRPKLLLMTDRKSHMRFRLASRLMTLDDLELV